MSKNADLQAFPNAQLDRSGLQLVVENTGGLTKREYFIAKAMQGLCANSNLANLSETTISRISIKIADSTLLCIGDEK